MLLLSEGTGERRSQRTLHPGCSVVGNEVCELRRGEKGGFRLGIHVKQMCFRSLPAKTKKGSTSTNY